jgi:hypothetical protein
LIRGGKYLDYKKSAQLQKLIKYLREHYKEGPIDEEKIIEDLKDSLSEEEIIESLQIGVNRGLIKVDMIVTCEECGEDLREIKILKEALGKEEKCEYCGKIFTVTEDNILRRYSLTYKGIGIYGRLLKKVHPFILNFNLVFRRFRWASVYRILLLLYMLVGFFLVFYGFISIKEYFLGLFVPLSLLIVDELRKRGRLR